MEITSKYLERFKALNSKNKPYTLKNNLLMVERLQDPEVKTKSGIIVNPVGSGKTTIHNVLSEKPHFCIVLDVGEGYTDAEGQLIPNSMSVKVGDIVLLPSISIKYFSLFGTMKNYSADEIGLVKETEIEMHFKGEEGLSAYFRLVNKGQE